MTTNNAKRASRGVGVGDRTRSQEPSEAVAVPLPFVLVVWVMGPNVWAEILGGGVLASVTACSGQMLVRE